MRGAVIDDTNNQRTCDDQYKILHVCRKIIEIINDVKYYSS